MPYDKIEATSQGLALVKTLISKLERGEILSFIIVGEATDGMFTASTEFADRFRIGGYMVSTANRILDTTR